MSGKVFDQIDPATEPETTSTETTDAPATETTNAETTENTDTAETSTTKTEAIMSEATTPTANAGIEISNVSKGDVDGQKRDKAAIDVILVRNRPQNRTAIVLDTKSMEKSEVPFVEGMVKDKRFDDLFVMDIKKNSTQRPVYATLHLTLDDLADRIAALPDDAWQPRHKNRPSVEV